MAHATFSLPTTVKFCFGATEQNMEMKLDNIASLGNKRSRWRTQKNNKSRIGNNIAARQARQKSNALRSSVLRQGRLADMRQQITQSKIAANKTIERRAIVAAMSVKRLRDRKNDAGRWNSSFQRSLRFSKQYPLSREISAHNSKTSVLEASQKTRTEKLVQQRCILVNAFTDRKNGSEWRSRKIDAEFNSPRRPCTLDARFASIRKERSNARNIPPKASNQTPRRGIYFR